MPESLLPIASQGAYHDVSLSPPQRFSSAHIATTTLKVEGMTCGACTSAVENAFKDLDGVGNVSVSLVMERAVVQHDSTKVSADAVKAAIEDRGFDAQIMSSDIPLPQTDDFEQTLSSEDEPIIPESNISTTTVSVGGMTCGACTSAVEGAFKDVAGIKSFSISLLSERAVIEHAASIVSLEKIAETIEDTGFDASIVESRAVPPSSRRRKRRKSGGQRKDAFTTTTTVAIEGMTCGACTSAVESGFKAVAGLVRFNISLLAERAIVVHNARLLSAAQIVEIVEDRGFDAKIISSVSTVEDNSNARSTVQLKVYGMVNGDAALDLESSLSKLPGLLQVNVSAKSSRTTITIDTSIIGLRVVVDAIEAAGYNALVADADDNNAQLESLAKTKEIQEWRRAFRISLMFSIPVFLTSMIFPMRPFRFLDYGSIQLPIPGLWLGDIVCLLLTIPVQFGIGRRFYRSALKSLRHGSPTMDVLVVTGTSAAFFFSILAMVVSVFTPPHSRPATVFDTSTMLITFITMGRMIENGAKSQTSKALSRLMSLAPSMATIYADPIAAEKLLEFQATQTASEKTPEHPESKTHLAEEKTIPTELIQVSDIVILRPGDKIPADGTVIRGQSHVDESMVTGEAMPIFKKSESLLMAGTVNGAGRLDFRVTRAGRDTQLSQIVRLVQEAQTSRAPVQRMADKVAGYFVPVILGLGALTFIAWMILSHILPHPPHVFLDHTSGGTFMVCLKLCISVIVFACPCALGLSTPTAVMVGTGVGAEQGILVKGGEVLETATKVTHVVFDKTGTLTTGKMSVADFSFDPPPSEDGASWTRLCWTAVGLAEMSSEHPIGKAIIRAAKDHLSMGSDDAFDGTVDNFEAIVGKGVSATVTALVTGSTTRRTLSVLIGNADFLRSRNVAVPDSLPAAAKAQASTTMIHVALSNIYTGVLHLSDTLKPSAPPTILALQRLGITSSLITGDAAPTAISIAELCHIPPENVHASCTPSQKQSLIQELQSQPANPPRHSSMLPSATRRSRGKKHVVAMVGDGINDSPALATAHIGLSLSSGTDVAMEAADIVLMHAGPHDLLDVPAALHLSRSIFGRIRWNLIWACGYNVVGLPFAMGVFLPWGVRLPPMAAGAAMAFSSVSVVGSSLLLRFWGRPAWMRMRGWGLDDGDGAAASLGEGLVGRGVRWLGVRSRSLGLGHSRRRSRAEERARGAYVPLQEVNEV